MSYRILLFALFLLPGSCISVEICDESYDSELVARFKTVHEAEVVDSTVSALTLYGIREGLSDSLLYDSASVSGFEVPLDPHRDLSRFVLQINDRTDTLTIYHHQEIYMISYTCGFANLFTLDHLESSSGIIAGDTIISPMIDAEYEANEEHIWLYL